MIRISISREDKDRPDWAHTHYNAIIVPDLQTLAQYIQNHVWSPIVWKEGYRKGDNFLCSDLLVMDFDDGEWTLDDAKGFCLDNNFAHIIGTTKSHQFWKGNKPPCDRFRLVIPWTAQILDKDTYVQNLKGVIEKIPCDKICYDAARKYNPCINIISLSATGKGVIHKPYKPIKRRSLSSYRAAGLLPRWVQAMLAESPPEGARDHHAFILGAKLAELGYSESEVISMVVSSPNSLPDSQKRKCAISGYKAGTN